MTVGQTCIVAVVVLLLHKYVTVVPGVLPVAAAVIAVQELVEPAVLAQTEVLPVVVTVKGAHAATELIAVAVQPFPVKVTVTV